LIGCFKCPFPLILPEKSLIRGSEKIALGSIVLELNMDEAALDPLYNEMGASFGPDKLTDRTMTKYPRGAKFGTLNGTGTPIRD
jgi:hypothetical protein